MRVHRRSGWQEAAGGPQSLGNKGADSDVRRGRRKMDMEGQRASEGKST